MEQLRPREAAFAGSGQGRKLDTEAPADEVAEIPKHDAEYPEDVVAEIPRGLKAVGPDAACTSVGSRHCVRVDGLREPGDERKPIRWLPPWSNVQQERYVVLGEPVHSLGPTCSRQ